MSEPIPKDANKLKRAEKALEAANSATLCGMVRARLARQRRDEELDSQGPPADWTRLRDQWEYSRTIRFVFQLLGFSTLLLSVLREIPPTPSRRREG